MAPVRKPEPFRTGSRTVPCKQKPIWFGSVRNGSCPVPCKRSLICSYVVARLFFVSRFRRNGFTKRNENRAWSQVTNSYTLWISLFICVLSIFNLSKGLSNIQFHLAKSQTKSVSAKKSHGLFQMIPFSCFKNDRVILMKWICDHRSESQFKQLRNKVRKNGIRTRGMASAFAMQCSTSWTMETHTLEAGQFIEFISFCVSSRGGTKTGLERAAEIEPGESVFDTVFYWETKRLFTTWSFWASS